MATKKIHIGAYQSKYDAPIKVFFSNVRVGSMLRIGREFVAKERNNSKYIEHFQRKMWTDSGNKITKTHERHHTIR